MFQRIGNISTSAMTFCLDFRLEVVFVAAILFSPGLGSIMTVVGDEKFSIFVVVVLTLDLVGLSIGVDDDFGVESEYLRCVCS